MSDLQPFIPPEITAEGARELSRKALEEFVDFPKISEKIRKAASTPGISSTSVDISKIIFVKRGPVFEKVKSHYESLGFKVTRHNFRDPRDQEDNDSITISW